METQVQDIIKKIRNEGVDQAKKVAAEILSNAKQEADDILATAKKESEKMVADAQKNTDHLLNTGKNALQQAARDLSLTVEQEIKGYFSRVLRSTSTEALSGKALSDLIGILIKEWASGSMTIELSEENLAVAGKAVQELLVQEAKSKGITIRPVKEQEGFVVKFDNEASYVDFSPEAVARMIAGRLQPWILALLHDEKA